jgi:hypothetical protein
MDFDKPRCREVSRPAGPSGAWRPAPSVSSEERKDECRRSWRLNKNPGDGAWLVDWLFEKLISGAENRVCIVMSWLRQIVGRCSNIYRMNSYCFAAEMWRHNRIAVAKGNARRFPNQMHTIATHPRHRA